MLIAACDEVGFKFLIAAVNAGVNVECVLITSEDRGGYNSQIVSFCKINQVDCFEDTDENWHNIKSKGFDIGVLAWWPRILNSFQLNTVTKFWLNTHPGLLPWTRGAHPYFWAIANNEPFGVTIQKADSGIDTGQILEQVVIPINWLDTGETLYRRAKDAIVPLLLKVISNVDAISEGQNIDQIGGGSFHLRKELESAKWLELDSQISVRNFLNLCRAATFKNETQIYFSENGTNYRVQLTISAINE